MLVEFVPQGQTIHSAMLLWNLKKLRQAIQNKRLGMLTIGVCLLYDNAIPHTSHATTKVLEKFGWDILFHPSHILDLAPSYYYHLFTKLNEDLGGKTFNDVRKVEEYVNIWLHGLTAKFYDDGMKKLVPQLHKMHWGIGD